MVEEALKQRLKYRTRCLACRLFVENQTIHTYSSLFRPVTL